LVACALAKIDDWRCVNAPCAIDHDHFQWARARASLQQYSIWLVLNPSDFHPVVLLDQKLSDILRIRAMPKQVRVRMLNDKWSDFVFAAIEVRNQKLEQGIFRKTLVLHATPLRSASG